MTPLTEQPLPHGVFDDITESRAREVELTLGSKTRSTRRWGCVFMFRADDFRFIYMNPGAKRMVGYR